MPFTYSPHVINEARAQQAADIYLIECDLDHVIECCALRLALKFSNPSDVTIARALSASAFIAYRRCFTKGKRLTLRDEDFGLFSQEEIHAHKVFLRVANQVHAHPVAANENGVVGLSIGKDGEGNLRRGGIQHNAVTTFDLGDVDAKALLALSTKLRDCVAQPKRKALEKALLQWLEQFDDSEIAAWPSALSAALLPSNILAARETLNKR